LFHFAYLKLIYRNLARPLVQGPRFEAQGPSSVAKDYGGVTEEVSLLAMELITGVGPQD